METKQDIINEALNKLQQVATDDEAMTIEQLAVRAGFWWKCDHEPTDDCDYEGCRFVNNIDDRVCGGCGRFK